jgi:hypothetical protein
MAILRIARSVRSAPPLCQFDPSGGISKMSVAP